MFQKICVVTDGSAGGNQAARLAAALSGSLGAELVESRRDGRAYREARAARLAAALGRAPASPTPRPFKTLVDEIRASDCDLVVVDAAEGRDGTFLGPTCERLLRRAHKDVLVVKDAGDDAGEDRKSTRLNSSH